MAIQVKHLAAGQLAASQTNQNLTAAVGSTKTQIIKNMRFHNTATSGSAIDLTVMLNSTNPAPFSGTTNKIILKTSIGIGASTVDTNELTLEQNHQLKYTTGAGGPIDFVISGIERDA